LSSMNKSKNNICIVGLLLTIFAYNKFITSKDVYTWWKLILPLLFPIEECRDLNLCSNMSL
jgi:hypothetical protein